MNKLLSFAPILLATRQKLVSGDSKKMKKCFAEIKILCLKSSETYAKKIHQNRSKKIMLRGLHPQGPGPRLFQMESP